MKPVTDTPKTSTIAADRHIGARVTLRRKALGMSQETLGAKLGLTFQQVQKYEKGANRIAAGRLLAIANILGVTPMFFYQGLPQVGASEDNAASDTANRFFTLTGADDLARDFAAIPSRADRAAIVTMVQIVANASRMTAMQQAAE